VALATLDGAHNTVPSFITANGPVREARFVTNPDGTPDGGVHDLFTIAGRSDAGSCTLAQPNFAAQVSANNIIFRIPTPLFGLGLVENVSDDALMANLAGTAQQRSSLGIAGNFNVQKEIGINGSFNTSGNTGNITRFGWKAQNPSLLVFAAEAYNVEMGVTNDGFPNERNNPPASCLLNPLPEDTTNLTDNGASNSPASDYSSDIVNFAAFMRMSAPPTPATPGTPTASATTTPATTASSTTTPATTASSTTTPSTTASATTAASTTTPSTTASSTSTTQVASANPTSVLSAASGTPSTSSTSSTGSTGSTVAADASQGQQVFQNVGCAACHTPSLTTGNAQLGAAETNVTYNPFSDFAVHNMGSGLADGVTQGAATGNQFRTAPLWGVGQRIFFLHDGRANDLVTAIEDHASQGSEANTVIQNFNMLSQANQQALVDFLRSL
jgi:mono/diheme cytochrome c family protein